MKESMLNTSHSVWHIVGFPLMLVSFRSRINSVGHKCAWENEVRIPTTCQGELALPLGSRSLPSASALGLSSRPQLSTATILVRPSAVPRAPDLAERFLGRQREKGEKEDKNTPPPPPEGHRALPTQGLPHASLHCLLLLIQTTLCFVEKWSPNWRVSGVKDLKDGRYDFTHLLMEMI